MKKPITLIVLDGWGYTTETKDNAIFSAYTPFFDKYLAMYPHALLEASGPAVGLPLGQVGNSEIGHTTIGAGTVLDSDLLRIKKAIDSKEYHTNQAFLEAFTHVQKNNSCLHLMSLLSDGGVHSHIDHLFELLFAAKKFGIKNIAIHVFTDGRDTGTTSSIEYIQKLQQVIAELGVGVIASISGRYWAMDRDNNWDRLDKTLQALFECKGNICTMDPTEFLRGQHKEGVTDEYIEPTLIEQFNQDPISIKQNDAIINTNFRSDRVRMLTEKLLQKKAELNLVISTMTQYKSDFDTHVAFPEKYIETTLAEQVSLAGFSQTHIAETEKFPHATYFLNGGVEKLYPKEKHVLLDSRKDVATHDLAPEMRALDIAEACVKTIEEGADFIFVNIANPDMVGHTANVEAIVKAIETTDTAMNTIVEATLKAGGVAIITADHGNAEQNKEIDGSLHTSHTYNLVPCILTDNAISVRSAGTLADLAPTVLDYLDIPKPEAMTGESLIVLI